MITLTEPVRVAMAGRSWSWSLEAPSGHWPDAEVPSPRPAAKAGWLIRPDRLVVTMSIGSANGIYDPAELRVDEWVIAGKVIRPDGTATGGRDRQTDYMIDTPPWVAALLAAMLDDARSGLMEAAGA